ncbi:MAG: Flp pilus assembly complex ATPase component TadA [Alphaproteobacteria bacterium]|nr:Flp pilus assembly complex ATPase component TadA [Alphaproteobacteria bacterium]
MNFWNKSGTKNRDEEMGSSSHLLDVSAIDIPDSDKNDQYGENVLDVTSNSSSTSFSDEENEGAFAPKIDHPAAPFMAPPTPSAPLSPTYQESSMAVEEYDDLPPLKTDETTTNLVEEKPLVTDAEPDVQEQVDSDLEEGTKMVADNSYPAGIIPMAQAPRSKTFVKQAEPEIKAVQKDEKADQEEKKEEKKISEDLEYIHYSNPLFLKKLFANGNTCITAPGAAFQLKDDMRSLLALFSNGRYFVAETYKYDGKVLSFEYLVKKRNLQIGKPEYVPMTVLSTIYEYAAQNTYAEDTDEVAEKPDVVEQAQARMQRDFITIISRAAAMHVSDIHIVVAENTIVMFRVNGLMQTEMEYKKEWGESFVRAAFASADISDANYAQNEYQAAQKLGRTPLRGSHGKLILPRNILGVRLQFNPIAFGTRYVVLRLLYAEESMESSSALEALGFTKKDTEDFYKLRGEPTGITIISGPTGSGKSTTLQRNMIAMLQERNYEVNLITVEDPPEYPIPGARQMPVTNATIEEAKEREFTKALAAALRSDPDSMMIGEVRTLSAADLAFRAALSGHNVWTTLHANNAPSILIRLKDMGVEEFKLKDPEIIKGLTAQRLFRRLCPHCRIPATERLSLPIIERLRTGFGDVALETTYLRGPGCKHCDFKGVKGRIAVSEIILPDTTFLELMLKGDTVKAINYWINELNGTTLRESALRHMFNGIIDIGEVERWTGFLDQTITG